MIVSYDGQLVRSIALEQSIAAEQIGDAAAAWLYALLAEIEAAETADDLFLLFGTDMTVERDSLSVVLGPGLAARFRVVREKVVFDASGSLAWSGVRRLKLMGVDVNDENG